jgi:hypothetical protein
MRILYTILSIKFILNIILILQIGMSDLHQPQWKQQQKTIAGGFIYGGG